MRRKMERREIFKIVIMLPTVPFRVLFIAFCVFGVAICNTIAIWGWWGWACSLLLGLGVAAGFSQNKWVI